MELDGDPTRIICSKIDLLLKDFHEKGLNDKNMVDFCSPLKKARPARPYFLKKCTKFLWESDLLFTPVKPQLKTFLNSLIFGYNL